MDAGLTHDLRVGAGAAGYAPFGSPAPLKLEPPPSVATYIIETEEMRYEIQDVVPVGYGSLNLAIGDRVTFAVHKKTIYVRDAKGTEHRLRVMKTIRKPKP